MKDETFGRAEILHVLMMTLVLGHFLTSVLQWGYRDRFDWDRGILLDFYHII